MTRNRLAVAVLVLGVAAAIGFGIGRPPRYATEADFVRAVTTDGWQVIGRFGEAWPARVAETSDGYGTITFAGPDGMRQTYQGYEGYELRVVRLRAGDGTESVRVLRSAEMSGEIGDELRR
ncbi:hypothetical protein KDM41_05645 [bacterium]|nr:hypothetical protein [bacterium]